MIETRENNSRSSSPSNTFGELEVAEAISISGAADATVDFPLGENFSISTIDLDFNSPTLSFIIPSPLSSAMNSPVGSLSDGPNKRCLGKIRTGNHTE